jgi:hypothetical protein
MDHIPANINQLLIHGGKYYFNFSTISVDKVKFAGTIPI